MSDRRENTTDSGTSRVRTTSDGKVYSDNYWGNVRDKDDHDRFSVPLNDGEGKPTGHGFYHESWDKDKK